jgi:hypothetical protein
MAPGEERPRMTTFDDEFYRDILDGLAVCFDGSFHRDLLETLTRFQEPALAVALNRNQMASKRWLAETLLETAGPELGRVRVLGGWFGALAAVLLADRRFAIANVESVDVDPRCAAVAEALNATHVRSGRFNARTADMLDLDYENRDRADLLVNTSCEHLPDFARWYARVPRGQLVVLQSNDYFACREHVNSVADLAAFRRQAPLTDVLFAGERKMKRYVRFMLIGRK